MWCSFIHKEQCLPTTHLIYKHFITGHNASWLNVLSLLNYETPDLDVFCEAQCCCHELGWGSFSMWKSCIEQFFFPSLDLSHSLWNNIVMIVKWERVRTDQITSMRSLNWTISSSVWINCLGDRSEHWWCMQNKLLSDSLILIYEKCMPEGGTL